MKGLLTQTSEREVLDGYSNEFLQDLKQTINNYCEKKECKDEVIHALTHNEYVATSLASNSDKIATFEVEAFVGDTLVLSFVSLVS